MIVEKINLVDMDRTLKANGYNGKGSISAYSSYNSNVGQAYVDNLRSFPETKLDSELYITEELEDGITRKEFINRGTKIKNSNGDYSLGYKVWWIYDSTVEQYYHNGKEIVEPTISVIRENVKNKRQAQGYNAQGEALWKRNIESDFSVL